jgi:hypothetical protein
MKYLLATLVAPGFLFFTSEIYSQSTGQFTLSGELRIRPELRRGYRAYPDTTSKAAFFVDQRARVNLNYSKEKFRIYGSLQEARTWGEEEQVKDVPSIGVHEFWGELDLCKTFSLKAGRQEIKYDDERLLGNADWIAQARSHDALLLKYRSANGWKVDVGGAYNQSAQNNFGTYYTLNSYKTLEYLWANKSWKDSLHEYKISGMLIGDGMQRTDTTGVATRITYGLHGQIISNQYQVWASAYAQSGKDIADKEISAYMFSLSAAVKASELWKIYAGFDYLSGTDQTDEENANKQKTFSTLYSSNHPYYGIADYFLNLPPDTKNGGLADGYLRAAYNQKKAEVNGAIHYLMLQNNVVLGGNTEEPLKKNLGWEVDVWGKYKVMKEVTALLGGSLIFGTESMAAIKGGNADELGAWIYTGISFSPVFFASGEK